MKKVEVFEEFEVYKNKKNSLHVPYKCYESSIILDSHIKKFAKLLINY